MIQPLLLQLLAKGADDAGPLAPVVVGAGWLISAAAAIGFAWRGKTRWEPAEEDLSRGPAKVSSLIFAVVLGLLWVLIGRTDGPRTALVWIAGIGAGVALLSLIVYAILIAVYVYDLETSTGHNTSEKTKIVGGFWLTKSARAHLKARPELTQQDELKGSAYKPDNVWPRLSRALAKAAFTLSYMALTLSGSIALAATAMLLIP